MINIFDFLKNNAYPGRGILVGEHAGKTVIAYFIMGRSVNSRNRIFVRKDDIIYTKAFDESKVADPSLIIYNAIRGYGEKTIVTNGDQTDTVYEYLCDHKSFEEALDTREYEPDEPNYTPRISAIIDEKGYDIAILRRINGECQRDYWHYARENNTGHFISTYAHDGNPLPSFEGKPLEVRIDLPFREFAEKLWKSLNPDNKVSLYVRFGNKEMIFNRNMED
ncbi:MAG: inosine monophosphate cyclohydrolase [Erysipelotrichaceae bacterium]|nr:inosine monophosphate cyclohydrolase [Erysipelotrichaceae bacterium]